MYIQPFITVVDWPEIWCLMEVSVVFYFSRYCVSTWEGRLPDMWCTVSKQNKSDVEHFSLLAFYLIILAFETAFQSENYFFFLFKKNEAWGWACGSWNGPLNLKWFNLHKTKHIKNKKQKQLIKPDNQFLLHSKGFQIMANKRKKKSSYFVLLYLEINIPDFRLISQYHITKWD